jgi:hypothetical protein
VPFRQLFPHPLRAMGRRKRWVRPVADLKNAVEMKAAHSG